MAELDKFKIRAAINYSKYEQDDSLEKLTVSDIILCHQFIGIGKPLSRRLRNKLIVIIRKIEKINWEPGTVRYNAEMRLEMVKGRKVIKLQE